MTTTSTMRTETLHVPGGHIYYEVRGSGPALLMMPGGPADATTFRQIEDTLAARYTVVTYDPRGISHSSPFDAGDDDRMVEIFADDAHRLLREVGGDGPCCVLARSGGAVIALELAARQPGQLDAVVFHEPPSPDLLADPAAIRAGMEDVCDTCAAAGIGPAAGKFMNLIGIHDGPPPPPEGDPTPEMREAMALVQGNMEFFFSRY